MQTRERNLHRVVSSLVVLGVTGTLTACGGGSTSSGVVVQSDKARITAPVLAAGDLAQLASDNNHFAVDLYQAVRAPAGNLIFSPESISIALAMTYAGAAGTTATQMASALHFSLAPARLHPAFDALDLALTSPGSGAGTFQLSLANALWAQQGFTLQPTFLDLLAENYGAGVHLVDFESATESARLSINQWVSEKTAGKIPDLLMQGVLDPSTRLVLTNAVYFKADWVTSFDKDSPDGTFNAPSGPVTVPMMRGPENVALWTGNGYSAASLPYVGGTTSMVLIVPDAGTFDTFEAGLTADTLAAITAAPDATQGALSMPRFKFTRSFGLRDVLMQLGMTDAFAPELADFSGIDGQRDLLISDVIHQADIAVDEKGTEAAAATAVVIRTQAVVSNNLFIDRPFLFLIRDDATSSILFMGRVSDPSQ
ncbi:MAG TPA: serpin family protein [Polyangia bacterium]|jgi:serpin B